MGKGEKTNISLIKVGDILKNSPIPPQTPCNDLLVADLVNFFIVTIPPLFSHFMYTHTIANIAPFKQKMFTKKKVQYIYRTPSTT